MSYELKKPYTDAQRLDFVLSHNLHLEETDLFLFALEANEIMGTKEIEIDVPDIDDDGNSILIEVEEEITIIDYDEEGNETGSHKETITKKVPQTHKETITIPYPVINPNYEQEQAEKREENFNKAFFNTSLGYIRRSVTMQNGSHKDFLSDLLPAISMSLTAGQTVNILAYDKPPFDHDITDWTEYQNSVAATAEFIQECFAQLSADFFPAPKKRKGK